MGSKGSPGYEGRRWSFAQLQADIDDTARTFIGLGILPGDHVAPWMPNRPEWLYTFFALAKLGAVVVPINTRFRTSSLSERTGYGALQSFETRP